MRAITIPEPGGPDALVWAEVPDPRPNPGELLIDVRASAVNRADLLQRQGSIRHRRALRRTRDWSARAWWPRSATA